MVSEKSRNSRNSWVPPFKWGRQRQLRCIKIEDGDTSHTSTGADHFVSSVYHRNRSPDYDSSAFGKGSLEVEKKRRSFNGPSRHFKNSPPPDSNSRKFPITGRVSVQVGGDDGGIETVRKKLVQELQSEVDMMKVAMFSEHNEEIKPSLSPQTMRKEVSAVETKPWNSRTRRTVCKEMNRNGANVCVGGVKESYRVDDRKPISSLFKTTAEVKSPRLRGAYVENCNGGGLKSSRAKFSVSLSKKEIEEDFYKILGTKPRGKPKKRLRQVQRKVDFVFPGLYLTEITPEMYKVKEHHEGGKT